MRQPSLMVLQDPQWVDVLRAEAAKPGRSKQAIADELDVSRTAISLLVAGKYSAGLDKFAEKHAAKVMALYAHQVWCPHLRASITPDACTDHRSAPMNTSDPTKLKHWAACRACKLNPDVAKSEVNNAV